MCQPNIEDATALSDILPYFVFFLVCCCSLLIVKIVLFYLS